MTALNVNRQELRSRPGARLVGLGLGLWLLSTALPALAANVLKDVSYQAGAGGKVDITLQFDQPVGEVQAFTTDTPPRIAIDLPGIENAAPERRITIGSGATSAVSMVEAGGRTRVVIDLFRPATYETRAEGSALVISVAGGATMAGATPALANPADPAKRVPATLAVANIDFKRSEEGAGRIVLRFDGEGAVADMRNEGDQVVVDIANASLPGSLQKRLDVVDFATPVATIEPRPNAGGTRMVVNTSGAYESMAYQTGNEYVVEVAPKAEPSATGGATVGGAEIKRYTGKPVTFNFQDIPVRTVLQLIAEESGLNVVAADTVQGNVTLRLINVPWDQAMDIVLRAKSLDKRQDGNVVWVAPQAELAAYEQAKEDARIALEQRAELITEYIPINYGNAEDIAKLLTDESKTGQGGGGGAAGGQVSRGFLSPRGSISFDRRTNTLLVIDIPNKVDEIKQLIALLDKPVDQVLIEARIVIATETFSREIGARFGVSGVQGDVVVSGSLESTTNFTNDLPTATPTNPPAFLFPSGLNVNLPVLPNAGQIALSILGTDAILDLELSAMQQEGRGEVISNPRIITSNQREAIIRQGDEVGYVTISPQTGGGEIPIPNVQFKDVLLELKVTPTITQDGRVFMAMEVSKDEVEGFIDTSIGQVPQIAKREINTAVLVDNGQTVVIGGVYEFSSREDLTKVPFLGDIPVLGALFRNKGKSSEKAELLIFVTPKILQVAGKH